eukprot:TRINITY_DN5799_c0_g1_i1.p6 TRINITY_DN5799_c0_g1~~TRINITY_DN5799_c0_g1_i1.p6  ORF type:complete len:229 (-),score=-15.88 TRINITY_DN5799_c0_g1_i1:1875-2561(-)
MYSVKYIENNYNTHLHQFSSKINSQKYIFIFIYIEMYIRTLAIGIKFKFHALLLQNFAYISYISCFWFVQEQIYFVEYFDNWDAFWEKCQEQITTQKFYYVNKQINVCIRQKFKINRSFFCWYKCQEQIQFLNFIVLLNFLSISNKNKNRVLNQNIKYGALFFNKVLCMVYCSNFRITYLVQALYMFIMYTHIYITNYTFCLFLNNKVSRIVILFELYILQAIHFAFF